MLFDSQYTNLASKALSFRRLQKTVVDLISLGDNYCHSILVVWCRNSEKGKCCQG